jgi:hypothetical protein
MYKTEGYWNVTARIKQLSFPRRGKFQVDLQDGRSIVMPVSAFPSLKRVPVKEQILLTDGRQELHQLFEDPLLLKKTYE